MIYVSNELSHHGVKGMKWGVRKEPYTKDQIRQRRKQLIEQAPKSDGRRRSRNAPPTKGYWKNASDAQISRLMDYEAKQTRKANKKPMSTAKKVAIGVACVAAVAGISYAAVKTGKAKQISTGAKLVHTKTKTEIAKNIYKGKRVSNPNKRLGRLTPSTSTGKYRIRAVDHSPARYSPRRIYNFSKNSYYHKKTIY